LRLCAVLRLAAGFFEFELVEGFAAEFAAAPSGAACVATDGGLFAPGDAAPFSVVAGASTGSTAPPDATQAFQPPKSGRTFLKP
jgi:hypothetical protein